MYRILITGICGFVGSSIARKFLSGNYGNIEIHGIDDLSYGYKERILDIQNQIKFYKNDVSMINNIVKNRYFDFIIHCAAIAPLPECQVNLERTIVQNVSKCGAIIDFAVKCGVKNIIFMSSGAVYEGCDTFPTPENIKTNTRLAYTNSKLLAEHFFESICKSYPINVTSIRLFNLYGPHQDYFRKQPPLIGYLLKSIINNETAFLYGNGLQRRDYIYIDDLTNLIFKIMNEMFIKDNGYTVLNAGSGISYSVNEIISLIENISNSKLTYVRMSEEGYWDKYDELSKNQIKLNKNIISDEVNKTTLADCSFALSKYGWESSTLIEIGLQECFQFAKQISWR